MPTTTRRAVLVAAGAGTVASAAVAAAPGAGAATLDTRSGQPFVAYVANDGSGTVTLLVGEQEVVVRDRDLVRRLRAAAGR